MKVIVCLDDHLGMLFNHRRLSKDQRVIEAIENRLNHSALYMNAYSYPLFENRNSINCIVDQSFLEIAEGYCFVEDNDLVMFADKIEELIIYWWNRSYPYDLKLAVDLADYRLSEQKEFVGNSHDKITEAIYRRKVL